MESHENEKRFIIDNNKFYLFSGDILISETGFNIELSDKWFNEKYITLHDFETDNKYQNKGYAKYLLEQIFNYVKNELKFDIIALIVFKNNNKAINLYFSVGFEIYIEYEDSYSLIKNLKHL